MRHIDYVYACDGNYELTVASAMDEYCTKNQSIISITRKGSPQNHILSIAALGEREYQCAISLLAELSESLLHGLKIEEEKEITSAEFDASNMIRIKVTRTKSNKGKYHISINADTTRYYLDKASPDQDGWETLDIVIRPEHARSISKAIKKAGDEWHPQPLMTVNTADWVISEEVLRAQDVEIAASYGLEECEIIRGQAPEIIRDAWIRLVRGRSGVQRINASKRICKTCFGIFSSRGKLWKSCNGCYSNEVPTALNKEVVKSIKNSRSII